MIKEIRSISLDILKIVGIFCIFFIALLITLSLGKYIIKYIIFPILDSNKYIMNTILLILIILVLFGLVLVLFGLVMLLWDYLKNVKKRAIK